MGTWETIVKVPEHQIPEPLFLLLCQDFLIQQRPIDISDHLHHPKTPCLHLNILLGLDVRAWDSGFVGTESTLMWIRGCKK